MYWTVAGVDVRCPPGQAPVPALTAAAIAGTFVGLAGRGPRRGASSGTENLSSSRPRHSWPSRSRSSRASSVGAPMPAGPPPAARRLGRRRRARGFDVVAASPLLKRVAIAYVLLAILMFSVQYPFHDQRGGHVPGRGRAGDRPRHPVRGRDGDLVPRVDLRRQPGLRPLRRCSAGACCCRSSTSSGSGCGSWPSRSRPPRRPVHAAGRPARPLELLVERVLQRRARRPARPGPRLQRRDPGPARDDPVGVLLLPPRAGSCTPDQLFWLGLRLALVAMVVVVGDPAAVRRQPRGRPPPRDREQVLEGGPGVEVLVRDPSVGPALIDGTGRPRARGPRDGCRPPLGWRRGSRSSDRPRPARRSGPAGRASRRSGRSPGTTPGIADTDTRARRGRPGPPRR